MAKKPAKYAPTVKATKSSGPARTEIPRTRGLSVANRRAALLEASAKQFRAGRFDRDTRNSRADAISRAANSVVAKAPPLVRGATFPSGKSFTVGADRPMIGGRKAATAFSQIRAAGPARLGGEGGIMAAKAGASGGGSGGDSGK